PPPGRRFALDRAPPSLPRAGGVWVSRHDADRGERSRALGRDLPRERQPAARVAAQLPGGAERFPYCTRATRRAAVARALGAVQGEPRGGGGIERAAAAAPPSSRFPRALIMGQGACAAA